MKSLKEALFSRKNIDNYSYHIDNIVNLLRKNKNDLLILSEKGPQFYTHRLHGKGTKYEHMGVCNIFLYFDRKLGLTDDGISSMNDDEIKDSISKSLEKNQGVYLINIGLNRSIIDMICSFKGHNIYFYNINEKLLKQIERNIPVKQYKEIEIIK